MTAAERHAALPGHAELAPEHAHPTWGECLCGHDGVEHLWTSGMRVDYQGECMHRPCECPTFHARAARASASPGGPE